ncbi:AEC family transporter [uncultured Hyphomonas sp.]|uniref:AEC family transporter n=1 Tax=uncultured Hyphomonas sp. TaxID=225298 RepID=UPI002AAA9799|nr:AEC family transporter [uncultured Hyphomonas sp.]
MTSNLLVVLPIFALILTGWGARRLRVMGPTAVSEINRFVVYLALPALLFDIMANADPKDLWQPGFIIAFAAGCLFVFILTVLLRRRKGAHLADAAIDGLNASYANTGFMGFPLLLAVVGSAAMSATLIATIVTVCVLFAIAMVLIESSLQAGASRRAVAWRTFLSLARNPLLLAPAAGFIVMLAGFQLPSAFDKYLKLLGAAASPCALIALGLFLADKSGSTSSAHRRSEAVLAALKLVAQPAVTWVIAFPVLGLPQAMAQTAVLLAALPTGTGPFMLTEYYSRDGLLTARTILTTTVLSIVTLSAYLALSE